MFSSLYSLIIHFSREGESEKKRFVILPFLPFLTDRPFGLFPYLFSHAKNGYCLGLSFHRGISFSDFFPIINKEFGLTGDFRGNA